MPKPFPLGTGSICLGGGGGGGGGGGPLKFRE